MLIKDHVVKLEREKELKQKTNMRASFRPPAVLMSRFQLQPSSPRPRDVSEFTSPHASWSCDCPSPPLFAIRTFPRRTFSGLSLRSVWLFISSDQKMMEPATSQTSASAGHFSDPSEESFHPPRRADTIDLTLCVEGLRLV